MANNYKDISLQGYTGLEALPSEQGSMIIQADIQEKQGKLINHVGSSVVAAYTELRQSMALRQSQVIDKTQSSLLRPNQGSRTNGNDVYSSSRAKSNASQMSKQIEKLDPSSRAVYAEGQQQTADQLAAEEDHKIPLDQLLNKLGVPSKEVGLTQQLAEEKNREYGDNKLPEKAKTPGWVIFLKELFNWFSIMLWVGAGLCVGAYFAEPSQGLGNVYLSIVLILVIFLTGAITFMQTAKSEALMDSFKNMIPTDCSVVRGGNNVKVDPIKLVPGDIISINSGDKIPADVRIIQSIEMKVDNSALTGESDPLLRSDKCTNDNVLETANMAFFGTLCKEGQGKGVVVRIGENTVLGQIADLAAGGTGQKTPLRQELDRFVLMITIIAISLGVVFFFAAKFLVKYSWVDSMVFGIGILVANVPEGLLGCITISLAITAEKLAKKQVLVKNLEGVETLGSTSCICSDKTGTLTQNKMTVEHIWYDRNIAKAENRQKMGQGFQYEYEIEDITFQELHKCAITSSEAVFEVDKKADQSQIVWLEAPVKGDASETALVKFFQPIEDIEATRQRVKTVINEEKQPVKMPFNSTNKYALNITEQIKDKSNYCIYIKGAPEKVWKYCSNLLVNGKYEEINAQINKEFENVNLQFGKSGERVLGFAKLHLNSEQFPLGFNFNVASPDKFNFPLENFTFVGLISMQDPPKDSVPYAVTKCRSAGVKVVMVTGDQPPTAGAIAKQVNIIPQNVKTNIDIMEEREREGIPIDWYEALDLADAIVVHGDKVTECLANDNANNEDGPEIDTTLQSWVKKPYCVFARTTPAHKLKIVKACQKVGYICGVTGDGVNDSPAIKQGDIGISMGITGSDVTKDAADMILLNDDFASIVDGVEEGRKIFDNLKKTVVYLLTSNVTEIFPFVAQILFLLPLPLSNMLMLCICVGTDILPALSLAYEAAELDIMTRRPRTKDEHMVTIRLITHAYLQMGVIASAAGFFAYFSTMKWYGFNMSGLFGLQGNILTAVRGDGILYGSYNPEQPDLGNPYLQLNYMDKAYSPDINYTVNCQKNNPDKPSTKSIQQAYLATNEIPDIAVTKVPTVAKKGDIPEHNRNYMDNFQAIDWLFQTDEQYDLRQIIVQCGTGEKGQETRWATLDGVFGQCQDIVGSELKSYNWMFSNENTGNSPDESPIKYAYATDASNVGNPNNKGIRIPVCYSTEALKYAQTAYFIAVVIVQWSNVLSVKAKKVSFIYTPWNSVMLYGVALETALCFILAYTPGIQEVFMSRPVNGYAWCGGMIFSMFLLFWCETRKYLIRRPAPAGSVNFFDKNVNW